MEGAPISAWSRAQGTTLLMEEANTLLTAQKPWDLQEAPGLSWEAHGRGSSLALPSHIE